MRRQKISKPHIHYTHHYITGSGSIEIDFVRNDLSDFCDELSESMLFLYKIY